MFHQNNSEDLNFGAKHNQSICTFTYILFFNNCYKKKGYEARGVFRTQSNIYD